jgi:uncharacterized protein YegP (UPF0339 family)
MSDAALQQQIERAREAGRETLRNEPQAVEARFDAETRQLTLELASGESLQFPVDQLEGLSGAPGDALGQFEVTPGGLGLHWEILDADIYVPTLVKGVYGTQEWMRSIGTLGGKARTEAKSQAARENGKKGGRPRECKTWVFSRDPVFFITRDKESSYDCFIGVLRAGNGHKLLETKPSRSKIEVLNFWTELCKLAIHRRLRFERERTDKCWQWRLHAEEGEALALSRCYSSQSTASRALGKLEAAISNARLEEDTANYM